jgi:ubiquinone/menaquinone biosynthesis C-methylase UbiE
MRVPSSIPFYDALATRYDALFDAPHRRAYDDLAWEVTRSLLPERPGVVIDAGCGTGRWIERIVELSHRVIGIEPAPAMAAVARARANGCGRFTVIESRMEDVDLPDASADAVLALGSLQYTRDPDTMLVRLARWARPGGRVVVLVDSLIALIAELVAAGKHDEALQRLETRVARWVLGDRDVQYHLLDRDRLQRMAERAPLTDVRIQGLLVGATILGRVGLCEALSRDAGAQIALERRLADVTGLADAGKQLLLVGRRVAMAGEQA